MEKQVLFIEGRREGYSIDQIRRTMTVGELIDFLSGYDEDTEIYLNNDNGYTYGSITWSSITSEYVEVEDEDEEDED